MSLTTDWTRLTRDTTTLMPARSITGSKWASARETTTFSSSAESRCLLRKSTWSAAVVPSTNGTLRNPRENIIRLSMKTTVVWWCNSNSRMVWTQRSWVITRRTGLSMTCLMPGRMASETPASWARPRQRQPDSGATREERMRWIIQTIIPKIWGTSWRKLSQVDTVPHQAMIHPPRKCHCSQSLSWI